MEVLTSSQSAPNLTRPPTGLLSHAAQELVSTTRSFQGLGATAPLGGQEPAFAGNRTAPAWATKGPFKTRSTFRAGSTGFNGSGAVFRETARSGMTPQRGLRANQMSSTSRQDGRPSTVARRENTKKEFFTQQIQQRTQRTGSQDRDAQDMSQDRIDSLDIMTETFRQDMRGVTDRLEDLARSFRMDNLKLKQEERDRLKREEERRQLEAEKRLARKREQAARDPKKKVALRLENRRRFAEDSKDDGVPMCPVEVDGPKGRELVPVVDVTRIRSRCLRLQEGSSASVESLIDLLRYKEKAAEDQAQMKKAIQALAKLPGASKEMPSELSYEERHVNCLSKKEAVYIEDVLRRLCKMRSDLPTTMAIDVQAIEQKLREDRRRREAAPPGEDNESPRFDNIFASLADKLVVSGGNSALAKSLNKLSKAITGEVMQVPDQKVGGPPVAGRRRTVIDEDAWKKALQRRVRYLKSVFKGACHWIMLFRRTVKRNAGIELIKATLRQLGEWARVQAAMKRTVKAVRTIQGICREFLVVKRTRCNKIAKDWERIEDRHLHRFFYKYSQQLIKEQMSQADNNPRSSGNSVKARQESQKFYNNLLSAVQEGEFALDWKAFKVPPKERAKVISGHYMGQLRTKVRTTGDLLKTTRMVLARHREIVGFLQQLGGKVGADEGRSMVIDRRKEQQMQKYLSWWEVPEETMLGLIGLAAQILKATGVEGFEDHPAHKDLPGNMMYTKPELDFKKLAAQGPRLLDQAVVRILQRSSLRKTLTEPSDKRKGRPGTKAGRVAVQKSAPPIKKSQSRQPSKTPVAERSSSSKGIADRDVDSSENAQAAGELVSQGGWDFNGKSDLEDVFDAFTPRLREIKQEQLLEYRIKNPPTESREALVPSNPWEGTGQR
eukprot:TRINITY_DN94391_c0_g1_i1.p1 TRINITY_DN94391_c0_g1~~TRINITY_DN94391_c0_g1_i1.p1  ORF type:complete len:920 (-),score=213.36 TRINITY_DN94391_c0_g1_i1:94-2775(-)